MHCTLYIIIYVYIMHIFNNMYIFIINYNMYFFSLWEYLPIYLITMPVSSYHTILLNEELGKDSPNQFS